MCCLVCIGKVKIVIVDGDVLGKILLDVVCWFYVFIVIGFIIVSIGDWVLGLFVLGV